MFLIAMISLTMSRISSRADFAVELGELGEIDRLDQRAEDRRLDLVIVFRAARFDRPAPAGGAIGGGAIGGDGTAGARDCRAAAGGAGAGSGARRGGLERPRIGVCSATLTEH